MADHSLHEDRADRVAVAPPCEAAAEAPQATARSHSVAEHLRDAILAGELEPGMRVNEVHLSRALGVSRTPIRTALHALAAEGLLDYAANRGFRVRQFPLSAIADSYEIRAVLEGLACRFAAELGLAEEQRRRIEAALAEGDALLEAGSLAPGDLNAYRTVNITIHDAILSAADNRMLADIIRKILNTPGATHRNIVAFNHRDVRRRHDDHHRIYEAICAKEGWRAEMLMREHIAGIKAVQVEALRTLGRSAGQGG